MASLARWFLAHEPTPPAWALEGKVNNTPNNPETPAPQQDERRALAKDIIDRMASRAVDDAIPALLAIEQYWQHSGGRRMVYE